ncbi:hypothetical protein EDC54_10334 [Samsonia erythrinae]|uniref:Uncharacterized protein n=1 Tax=Samsonia erythrinae TaxID=160434 RepID=A0A4R3VQ49_9GAMM|nr:hypothetical protein EDC54_10334 [Samsonia erythrinae]
MTSEQVDAVHHIMAIIEQRKLAETSGNGALQSQRMREKLLENTAVMIMFGSYCMRNA